MVEGSEEQTERKIHRVKAVVIGAGASAEEQTERKIHSVKVVVIGAGGAGLMCAHQLLQKNGIIRPDDVLILEARDRVGGRIHSTLESRRTSSNNGKGQNAEFFLDHGAAWVHGTGGDWPSLRPESSAVNADMLEKNPMMDLLKQITSSDENVCVAQLNPIFERGNPWMNPNKVLLQPKELVLFMNGTQVGSCASESPLPATQSKSKISDDKILSDALELHDNIMEQVAKIGYNLVSNGQTMEAVRQSFQQALNIVLSDESNRSSAQTDPLIPLVAGFYRHLISCWHATDASELQLYEFSALDPDDEDDEQYVDEGDYYGPHCTMKNGMITVLKPLLETTQKCIRQNETVVRVGRRSKLNKSDTIIRVETASGMIVEADCCVVTVSQGCLAEALRDCRSQIDQSDPSTMENTICFDESLSAEKVEAVENLCMGTYKKVFLTFDRIFWPPNEAFIGLGRTEDCRAPAIDGLGDYLLLDNLWARCGIPCIEAVLIGKAGLWATGKTDAVIRDSVLHFLSKAMGLDSEIQLQEWCVDCHVTRWEEDPYSRGAYSGYRLGTLPKHTEDLATSEWEGHLVFAGEATVSGYEGSVYAALMSGKRAAEEVEACIMAKGA